MGKGRVACALLLGQCLYGCSYLWVTGPPDHPERLAYFDCTPGVAAPVIDTVITALEVSSVASYGRYRREADLQTANAMLTTALVGLALFGSSAVYGYYESAACREARTAQFERGPPGPGPYYNGCQRDIDCKGDRICYNGSCVPPAPSALPPAPPPMLPPPPGASPPSAPRDLPPPPPQALPPPPDASPE
jgi:hypothetical protein